MTIGDRRLSFVPPFRWDLSAEIDISNDLRDSGYLSCYFPKKSIWYLYPLPLGNPNDLNARINRAGPF